MMSSRQLLLVVVFTLVGSMAIAPAQGLVDDIDFTALQPSLTGTGVASFRIPQMRVLVADFLALSTDYPTFATMNMTSEDIETWLAAQTSFLSSFQLGRTPQSWAPDDPLPCVVNPLQTRELLKAEGENRVPGALERVFVPLPVVTADEGQHFYGYAELEGVGVQKPVQAVVEHSDDDLEELRQGYLPLHRGLAAFAMNQLLDGLLLEYYKDAPAGQPRFNTVAYYALLTTHCLVKAEEFGGPQQGLVSTSVLVKQGAAIADAPNQRNVRLALDHVLSQLDMHVDGPVNMYVDGYHFGDFLQLSFGRSNATNGFSECIASTALPEGTGLSVGGAAAIEHCLAEFGLPSGLVRPFAERRQLEHNEEDFGERVWEASANITKHWVKQYQMSVTQKWMAERDRGKPDRKSEKLEAWARLNAIPNFSELAEDQPVRQLLASFMASVRAATVQPSGTEGTDN